MTLAIILATGILLMLVGSQLSRAGQIKRQLRPFVGRTVLLPDDSQLTIESIAAIGPGLHIKFRRTDNSRINLKVAQPTSVSITAERIEIPDARYVQWGSRKGPPPVVLKLASRA